MLKVALGTETGLLAATRCRLRLTLLGTRPVDDQNLPDALHRAGVERGANFRRHAPASFPVVTQHPNLDQLVTLERDIDFMQHGRRQARLTDHDDRMERVGPGAQRAPLGGRESSHNFEF